MFEASQKPISSPRFLRSFHQRCNSSIKSDHACCSLAGSIRGAKLLVHSFSSERYPGEDSARVSRLSEMCGITGVKIARITFAQNPRISIDTRGENRNGSSDRFRQKRWCLNLRRSICASVDCGIRGSRRPERYTPLLLCASQLRY